MDKYKDYDTLTATIVQTEEDMERSLWKKAKLEWVQGEKYRKGKVGFNYINKKIHNTLRRVKIRCIEGIIEYV